MKKIIKIIGSILKNIKCKCSSTCCKSSCYMNEEGQEEEDLKKKMDSILEDIIDGHISNSESSDDDLPDH